MTNDEIVALGDYCHTLRHNAQFVTVLDQFEQQITRHFLATEPHETKKREGIYASLSGVRDFLGHIDALISEASIIRQANEARSDPDAV